MWERLEVVGRWLRRWWPWVGGTVVFLAALLTLIVRGDTIRGWVFPTQEPTHYGDVLYKFYDATFRWPSTHPIADDKSKKMFEESQGYSRIYIQNVSSITLVGVQIQFPVESIIEVVGKDGAVRNYGIADSFRVGDLSAGDHLTIHVWSKRPFTQNDLVTVSHETGSIVLKPAREMSTDDFDAYVSGYHLYRGTTIVLVVVLFVLVISLLWKRTPPKRQRSLRKKKPSPDDEASPSGG